MISGMPTRFPWALLISVAATLSIFGLTFLPYAGAHAKQQPGGYAPAILGVVVFAVFMAATNYWALSGREPSTRLAWSVGVAIAETGVFCIALLFVLINSFGS